MEGVQFKVWRKVPEGCHDPLHRASANLSLFRHNSDHTFEREAKTKASQNVRQPVGRKHDAGSNQRGAGCPDEVPDLGRQERCGGRKCSDMKSVARWKGVRRLSRKRHATPVTPDCATVRSLLRDERLENMRQDGCRERGC